MDISTNVTNETNPEPIDCRNCKPHFCKWSIPPERWFMDHCFDQEFQSACQVPPGKIHCLACHQDVTPSSKHSKEYLVQHHVRSKRHFKNVTALWNIPAPIKQEPEEWVKWAQAQLVKYDAKNRSTRKKNKKSKKGLFSYSSFPNRESRSHS